MAIYFDNSNIITGSRGPEGPQGIQGKQGPAGPNEISIDTASSITGILKGNGSTVAVAEAGVDYATSEQAKAFVVTFTMNEDKIVTADKTIQEIIAAYKAKRIVLGVLLSNGNPILQLVSVTESSSLILFTALGNAGMVALIGHGSRWKLLQSVFTISPTKATALPDSGTALTANTIYAVADAVGTYAFTPPASGWAHGTFTTGASVSVSFSGTFMGTAPTIEASKTYEFDVLDGVWAVQEVVSA